MWCHGKCEDGYLEQGIMKENSRRKCLSRVWEVEGDWVRWRKKLSRATSMPAAPTFSLGQTTLLTALPSSPIKPTPEDLTHETSSSVFSIRVVDLMKIDKGPERYHSKKYPIK